MALFCLASVMQLTHLPPTCRHQLHLSDFSAHQYMYCLYHLSSTGTCISSLAARSCCSHHAGCLAFLGGSAEALTRSVWLRWAVLRALDSPDPAPQRPASLFSSLSLFSFPQFLHRLPVSVPLCLPIYQRELLSRLLRAGVGKRWKGCLIARKNLQLCFILYRTGCCSCRCRSASAAASHQIFSPPHKKTCLLPVLQIDPLRWHKMAGIQHQCDCYTSFLLVIPPGLVLCWICINFQAYLHSSPSRYAIRPTATRW